MNFQDTIRALEEFWAGQGCIIEQSYDLEVSAGTMSPASFLRSLGPEPWQSAFVQPCRRPADSRYGENPLRLYRHFQFQVILKPSPDDIQEMYLDSLRALGFDLRQHEVRFVEDDWESLALDASGVGWQVWLDGVEVTQFTYFQTAGGQELSPVSVELTYGLERICMGIQHVKHFKDIRWNESITYGQIYGERETNWGQYNFEQADTGLTRSFFEEYEREAYRLLEQDAVLPAYDFTLKCSHQFNLLQARGMIPSSSEKSYIDRVQNLARLCAAGYIRQRESLGFPLTPSPATDEK